MKNTIIIKGESTHVNSKISIIDLIIDEYEGSNARINNVNMCNVIIENIKIMFLVLIL